MRRFSSSTSRTALLRRRTSRRQASRRSAIGMLLADGDAKVALVLAAAAWSSVARFGPSRRRIRFFSAVLVTETSIVRSSRSSPSRTFSSKLHRALQHEVAGQHVVAEAACGSSRSAWPRSDLPARDEQRNLAHLHQVHPHRIVDAGARSADLVELDSSSSSATASSSSSASSSSKAVELRVDRVVVDAVATFRRAVPGRPVAAGDFLLLRGGALGAAARRCATSSERWRTVFLRVAVLRAFLAKGRLLGVGQGCGGGRGFGRAEKAVRVPTVAGESAHIGINPDLVKDLGDAIGAAVRPLASRRRVVSRHRMAAVRRGVSAAASSLPTACRRASLLPRRTHQYVRDSRLRLLRVAALGRVFALVRWQFRATF